MLSPLDKTPFDIREGLDKVRERDYVTYNSITKWRGMYDLVWSPPNILDPSIEIAVDPTPKNAIDYVTDRISNNGYQVFVPINHLNIEIDAQFAKGVKPQDLGLQLGQFLPEDINPWLEQIEKNPTPENAKAREWASNSRQDAARKRSEEIQKALQAIEERNGVEQGEDLFKTRVHHALKDGQILTRIQFNKNHGSEEVPIVLQVLDSMNYCEQKNLYNQRECWYTIRKTKRDLLDQWGLDFRESYLDKDGVTCYDDDEEIEIVDYWCEFTEGQNYKNVKVCHALVCEDEFLIDPEVVKYPSIPYVLTQVKAVYDRNGQRVPQSFLKAYESTWEQENQYDTRMALRMKQAIINDFLWVSGTTPDQDVGKGKGAVIPIDPGEDVRPLHLPPLGNDFTNYEQKLAMKAQHSVLPFASYGAGSGATSGQQIEELKDGAEVRFGSYIDSLALHMQREYVFILKLIKNFKNKIKKVEVWGVNPAGDPFVYEMLADEVGGDYRVIVKIDSRTSLEKLRDMVAALRVREGATPLIDDATILESLGFNNPRQIRQRVQEQLVEDHQDMIQMKVNEQLAQQMTGSFMQAVSKLIDDTVMKKIQEAMPQQPQMGQQVPNVGSLSEAIPGAPVPGPINNQTGPLTGLSAPQNGTPMMPVGGLPGVAPEQVAPTNFVAPGAQVGGASEMPNDLANAITQLQAGQ